MGVTIDTAQVRAAGKSAKDIGTTTMRWAENSLDLAEADVIYAKVGELTATVSMDDVFVLWGAFTGGFVLTLDSVGDKLVTTASEYEKGDDDSGNEFEHVVPEPEPHQPDRGW